MPRASLLLGLVVLSSLWTTSEARIVAQYHGGSVTFLANRFGDKSSAWRATLPMGIHHIPPGDEYVLDFWLRYRDGWIEGAGGKIAGFGGGSITSGCRPITPGGWSLRLMWSPLQAYLYHQNRTGRCGDEEPFTPRTLPVGTWHRITQRVRINTPNVANGIYQIWVNGQQTYTRTNLRLRGNVSASTARISRVFLWPFRGGDDPEWAVSRDTTLDLSAVYVLDCVPTFGSGSPTTAPTCDGSAPPAIGPPPALQPPPAAQTTAAHLWAVWDMEDLGTHAPPSQFILTVEHTSGGGVPPPLRIPWGRCVALFPQVQTPALRAAAHCAPVGCPPTGTYRFWVEAQYAEGLSAPSNIATCRIDAGQCVCATGPIVVRPLPPKPPPGGLPPIPQLPQFPPGVPPLSQELPPLVPVNMADLHLQSIEDLPTTTAIIPPIPAPLEGA